MADVFHVNLTGADLHEPKPHVTSHESGGSDELSIVSAKVLIGATDTLSGFGSGVYTKNITFENQVPNGNFELWSGGVSAAPDGWSITGTILRESSIKKIGNYSAKVTGNISTDSILSSSIQTFKGMPYWQGRTVTVSAFVRADTASAVRVRIWDGSSFVGSSDYHSGGGTWEELYVTGTIGGSATEVSIFLVTEANSPAATSYFDGVMCIEGSVPFAFTPTPSESLASAPTPIIITDTGVGIGQIPTEDLDVLGNIAVSGYLTNGGDTVTVAQMKFAYDNTIDLSANTFQFGDGVSSNKLIKVNTGDPNLPALQYNVGTGTWQFSNDGTTYNDMGSGGGGGGGSGELVIQIGQLAHGLAVQDVLYFDGSDYVKAIATSEATAEVIGMVTNVIDVNTFDLTVGGYISGLSGLVAGTAYYLSNTVAGGIQTTEPDIEGHISKPIFVAVSSSSGYFINYRGIELRGITGVSGYPITVEDLDADTGVYTETNPDEDYLRFFTASVQRMTISNLGAITFNDAFTFPNADGTNGQVMQTNGSGVVTWVTPASEADTLDDVTGRGATTTNAIIVGNVTIGSGGSGVDYTLTFNGEDNDGVITYLEDEDVFQLSSALKIGAYTLPATDGTNGYVLKTNGAGNATWQAEAAESDTLDDVTGRGGSTANSIQVGGLSLGGNYSLPTVDGSASYILRTNGSGTVSWSAETADSDTLDLVTGRGASTTNAIVVGNITIGSGGSGVDYTLTFNGESNDGVITWMEDEDYFNFNTAIRIGSAYTLPAIDGTADYVLKTNGSGVVSWSAESSGFADPMTTRGDIIIRNAANSTARLGIGPVGQALISDGTDIAWGSVSVNPTLDDVTTNGNTTTNDITVGNVTVGSGGSGIDYTLTFNGEDNDGVITFLEDENVLQLNTALKIGAYTLPATDGTSGYVLKTNGSGVVTWQAESVEADTLDDVTGRGSSTTNDISVGNVTIGSGGSSDYTLTFNGAVSDGVIKWMDDETALSLPAKVGIGTDTPTVSLDVVGIIASDDAIFLDEVGATAQASLYIRNYNATQITYAPLIQFRKSNSDTLVNVETDSGEYLGELRFMGVNSSNASARGATIKAIQDDAAGVDYVPTRLELTTHSSTEQNTNQLVLDSNGYVGIGDVAPTSKLTVSEGNVIVRRSQADTKLVVDTFSSSISNEPAIAIRKSHSDTLGTNVETVNNETLGYISFSGVDTGPTSRTSSRIIVTQDGASGAAYVASEMVLESSGTSGLNTNQIVLNSDGTVTLSQALLIGDGTTSTDKIVYANNGDANKPFLMYDETENEWVCSDDGTNTSPINSIESRQFIIDGGGSTITTGIKGCIQAVHDGVLTSVTMLADQPGSIVVDIWKDTYANYPPTGADTITASAPPTISSTNKSTDSTLSGWTTSFSAGDVFYFNADSVTTIQWVTIVLTYRKV